MTRIGFSLLLAFTAFAGTAYAAAPAMEKTTDEHAVMFVDARGMALYTYDEDKAGKSKCNADCEKKWPAFVAPDGAKAEGDWSTVKRDDGRLQWAYKGKPLYTWVIDTTAGVATGDNKGGVWHIARP